MNVTIRPREEGDRPVLDEFFEHPEVSRQLWLPSNAESWISESRKSLEPAYRSRIMVDGKVAGITALEYPTLPRDEYQVNFVLGRDYWDRGIASEVLHQTVRFGFDVLGLNGVFTATEADNPAMTQVLEAVGFHKRMVWKEHVLKGGRYLDVLHWMVS